MPRKISSRNVDPGNFVQNATTGASETLIGVARIDLVTVVTKLPENVAPFLSRTTEATLEFDDLPGVSFAGRVTRYAPAVSISERSSSSLKARIAGASARPSGASCSSIPEVG